MKSLVVCVMLTVMSSAVFANLSKKAMRIERNAHQLKMAIEAFQYGNGSKYAVRQEIQDLQRILDNLRAELKGGGPGYQPGPGYNPGPSYPPYNPGPHVPGPSFPPYNPGPSYPPVSKFTASCRVDVGGNFFTPKTYLDCTIRGKGATSYEILANGRVTWTGQLDRQKAMQNLRTDKQKVGGNSARYTVNVFDRQGRRHTVFVR